MDAKVVPKTAYAAVLGNRGIVLTDDKSLSDPNLPAVIGWEFKTVTPMQSWNTSKVHRGIHHPDLGLSEVFGYDNDPEVVGPARQIYSIIMGVIDHFKDQLLSGPGTVLREEATEEAVLDFKNWCDDDACKELIDEINKSTVDEVYQVISSYKKFSGGGTLYSTLYDRY